ncbi:KilA-N domain-containing protein [Adonisia turfae]|uniref:KilA-N domain-containing protein n=1 Tax=Adonisia turfae CCMR0081 TaxID=2292702 RepID=A0A6M0RHT1_9CYAN|nr:KilA-N domain-containing protein [Adonisia turfae]NEZ55480.1 KilA-N domain-containing protein [Adonisia turfae CCMR0081]
MASKKFIRRCINEIDIAQRVDNGFINATAMCVAHNLDVSDWLATDAVFRVVSALAKRLGIPPNPGISPNSAKTRVSRTFPDLVVARRGSPANGGGTWIHYKLAVSLAQWCNAEFALLVSDWVESWIITHQTPITSQEAYRVESRDCLKDEARSHLVGQVKSYLMTLKRYVQGYREDYFKEVHNALNLAITSETASQMRKRISKELGRDIKQGELIRDYFPAQYLHYYISMCNVAANLIQSGYDPLSAIDEASRLALPPNYVAKPIDQFEGPIKSLRTRQSRSQNILFA